MRYLGILRAAAFLLAGGAILFAQPGATQITDIGQRVINTIQGGDDLSGLAIFHPNYVDEAPGVASLRGCEYSVLPLSKPDELHVDWVCSDSKFDAFTRIYLPRGKLSRIEVQPGLKHMKPTKLGLSLSTLPSRNDINKQFQKSVRAGADPTLGGLIPITSDHLRQLKKMKGWVVIRTDKSGEYGINMVWLNNGRAPSDAADTTLHFDPKGRPIGLWIRTAPIRSVLASEVGL